MNTPQEHHGEHRRGEGLGGRVRRFVDTELSRVLDKDKEDRGARKRTDPPANPDPAGHDDVVDRGYDSPPVRETPVHETPVHETPAYESRRAHDPDPGMYSESADSYPGDSYPGRAGTADSPATTAPYDAGRETRLQPTGPEEFRGQSGDQLAADDTGAARVGLLNDVGGLRDEWQQVQSTFVDDPQRAVQEAGAMVERMLEEIRANVGSKRPTDTMSTEDLRVSFQRYREFFQRLLAA